MRIESQKGQEGLIKAFYKYPEKKLLKRDVKKLKLLKNLKNLKNGDVEDFDCKNNLFSFIQKRKEEMVADTDEELDGLFKNFIFVLL